jgi:ABC-type antimicrobial peptide transport system permease subunit
MLIGIIIFFIVIWIVIKAFSSNEKEVHVTKIDKETGNETTEIRKEVSGSAGKTAAQTTLWIFVGIPVIFIIIVLMAS